MRRMAACVILTSVCAACQPALMRYPSVCDDVVDCLMGNPILNNVGSGGPEAGTDATVVGTDAGEAGVTSIAIQGQLAVAISIPITSGASGPMPTDGWQITAVDDPTIAPVTTTDGGLFSFASVPLVGGAYRLSATPPASTGTLQAFMQAAPSGSPERPQFVAITADALQMVAVAASTTVEPSSTQFVVQLIGLPANISGVSVDLRDDTDRTLAIGPVYDVDGATFSAAATVTGSRGIAAFFNVGGAITGRPLLVRLARGATTMVEYSVTAYPGHVAWVPLAPP